METVISLENIRKVYKLGRNSLEVLKGIDMKITKGEFVAILGPSGSGKSTVMNILGCIDEKTEGSYNLAGQDIETLSDDQLANIRNNKIGFIFQKFNLISKYNMLYNVQMPLIIRGETSKGTEEVAKEMLDKVGLLDRIDHRPNELSGGQQQRVAIARALITNPEIILADEPTGNLDSKSGEEVMKILNRLNSEGKTIILITHDEETAKHANRIIYIKDGLIEKEVVNNEIYSY
ncbi:MAG: ABC transporter ATP-binding protein [Clostridia bacterium]|jgi:putative ABC transport system ATP-binding protein|nr:ABC transporter ATP-binding protein [Clostridia bacterium]